MTWTNRLLDSSLFSLASHLEDDGQESWNSNVLNLNSLVYEIASLPGMWLLRYVRWGKTTRSWSPAQSGRWAARAARLSLRGNPCVLYVCMHIYIHILYICINYLYIYVCAHMYTIVCIYMHTCIYIYIHIHIPSTIEPSTT